MLDGPEKIDGQSEKQQIARKKGPDQRKNCNWIDVSKKTAATLRVNMRAVSDISHHWPLDGPKDWLVNSCSGSTGTITAAMMI
jgi:hypothetical protein